MFLHLETKSHWEKNWQKYWNGDVETKESVSLQRNFFTKLINKKQSLPWCKDVESSLTDFQRFHCVLACMEILELKFLLKSLFKGSIIFKWNLRWHPDHLLGPGRVIWQPEICPDTDPEWGRWSRRWWSRKQHYFSSCPWSHSEWENLMRLESF